MAKDVLLLLLCIMSGVVGVMLAPLFVPILIGVVIFLVVKECNKPEK